MPGVESLVEDTHGMRSSLIKSMSIGFMQCDNDLPAVMGHASIPRLNAIDSRGQAAPASQLRPRTAIICIIRK